MSGSDLAASSEASLKSESVKCQESQSLFAELCAREEDPYLDMVRSVQGTDVSGLSNVSQIEVHLRKHSVLLRYGGQQTRCVGAEFLQIRSEFSAETSSQKLQGCAHLQHRSPA